MPTADRSPAPAPARPRSGPPGPPAPAAAGYRALRVWQRALDLAVDAAPLARTLTEHGLGALGADLFRAATAVPAHIAAGSTAAARTDHQRALGAALAAVARFETLVAAADRLAPGEAARCAALLAGTADVTRLLRAFTRAVGGAPPGARRHPAGATPEGGTALGVAHDPPDHHADRGPAPAAEPGEPTGAAVDRGHTASADRADSTDPAGPTDHAGPADRAATADPTAPSPSHAAAPVALTLVHTAPAAPPARRARRPRRAGA
jgi:four helix bundle protein